MKHVTQEQLLELQVGGLPLAEIAAMSAHLRSCDECSAKVAESQAVRRMAGDIRTQIEAEDGYGEGNVAASPAPRPARRWLLPLAATLAALVAAAWYFVFRPAPPTRPVAAPIRVETPPVTPVPRQQPAGYGRESWDKLVRDAVSSGTLAVPAVLQSLQPPEAAFRGSETFDEQSLAPSGAVVRETRPRFRWKPVPGARYTVILAIDDDSVLESDRLTAPSWRPPSDLQRGREYAWQVEIDGTTYPRAPRPPARFRILGQAEAAELDEARRAFPDDHLLQAVLLAKHGLGPEAEGELLEYRSTGDVKVAEALLRSIRTWPSRRPT